MLGSAPGVDVNVRSIYSTNSKKTNLGPYSYSVFKSASWLFFEISSAEQLEEGYRTQLASQKQQWAATAETQTKKTRDALKIEFDKARTDHSRKLDSLENSIINANARLKKALAGAEEARESARIERSKLDSTLAGLRRQIVDKEGSLQKAYEAARKVKAAEAPQVDNDLQSKLMRVFADLESEREHVSELEGQLKEANSTAVASFSQPGADFDRVAELKPGREEGDIERVTILEDKLGLTLRENENLKKGAAQKIVLGSEAKPKNDHFTELKKALKEAEMRLSEVQQVKKLAVQVSEYPLATIITRVHCKKMLPAIHVSALLFFKSARSTSKLQKTDRLRFTRQLKPSESPEPSL